MFFSNDPSRGISSGRFDERFKSVRSWHSTCTTTANGTIVDLFANLDERHRRLAVEAIKLRFGVEKQGREY